VTEFAAQALCCPRALDLAPARVERDEKQAVFCVVFVCHPSPKSKPTLGALSYTYLTITSTWLGAYLLLKVKPIFPTYALAF
jgi:hypothetical protein